MPRPAGTTSSIHSIVGVRWPGVDSNCCCPFIGIPTWLAFQVPLLGFPCSCKRKRIYDSRMSYTTSLWYKKMSFQFRVHFLYGRLWNKKCAFWRISGLRQTKLFCKVVKKHGIFIWQPSWAALALQGTVPAKAVSLRRLYQFLRKHAIIFVQSSFVRKILKLLMLFFSTTVHGYVLPKKYKRSAKELATSAQRINYSKSG